MTGIQNHTVSNLNIVHAAFVATSNQGPVICHLPESASMPCGKTILSTLHVADEIDTGTTAPDDSNESVFFFSDSDSDSPYIEPIIATQFYGIARVQCAWTPTTQPSPR
jgi:hypothetical protein